VLVELERVKLQQWKMQEYYGKREEFNVDANITTGNACLAAFIGVMQRMQNLRKV